MNDLSQVGSFLLNVFVTVWNFLIKDAGWVGVAVLGFVVVRLIIFAVGFLLAHRDPDK